MGSVSAPSGNSLYTAGFLNNLQESPSATQTLEGGFNSTLPSSLQPNVSDNFAADPISTYTISTDPFTNTPISADPVAANYTATPALSGAGVLNTGAVDENLLPSDLSFYNNPNVNAAIGANAGGLQGQAAQNYMQMVESPQLGAAAEQSYLGGNLGTAGSSSFGANYLANQQATDEGQSLFQGQTYATNALNNFLNSRNSYFANDLGLASQQNAAQVNEGLQLNAQNEQASLANQQNFFNTEAANQQNAYETALADQQNNYQVGASNQQNNFEVGAANQNNQLATNQLNQGGQIANDQLTQSGLGEVNNYNLQAAQDQNSFQTNAANLYNQANTTTMQNQLQAEEATAQERAGLLTGGLSLLGGTIGAATGGSSGGSSGYSSGGNYGIGSGFTSGIPNVVYGGGSTGSIYTPANVSGFSNGLSSLGAGLYNLGSNAVSGFSSGLNSLFGSNF